MKSPKMMVSKNNKNVVTKKSNKNVTYNEHTQKLISEQNSREDSLKIYYKFLNDYII